MSDPLAPRAEWRETAERAFAAARAAGADEAEVYLSAVEMVEVGIEKDEIQLVRALDERGLGLRVHRGRAPGFASANTHDPGAIREIAAGAVAQAKAAIPDPGGTLPAPARLAPVAGLHDPAIAAVPLERAVEWARAALDAARAVDPRVRVDGGSLVLQHGEEGVVSTTGVACAERFSAVTLTLMGMAVEGEAVGSLDYDDVSRRALAGFDPAAFGRAMGGKFLAALHPVRAKSFKGTLLFHPRAVEGLILGALMNALCAESVQRGASPLAGKTGRAIAAPLLDLADDGTLPGAIGSASFDREGQPHRRLPLIEKGVLANYLYRHGSAIQDGVATTGHAAGGARGAPVTGPTNLLIAGGAASLAELESGLDYSLLVDRVSGHPNPITGEFSCAVKGARLIEKGAVGGPVTEVLIRGNAFELLKNVVAVSRERLERPGVTSPWLLIDGIDVTAG